MLFLIVIGDMGREGMKDGWKGGKEARKQGKS